MTYRTIALGLVLVTCGCSSLEDAYNNADYVRDHGCKTDGIIKSSGGAVLVIEGRETVVGGDSKPYFFYQCPNGLFVMVYTAERANNAKP